MDGTRATGKNAFRAGQPTQASSTQNTAASGMTSYIPAIDPQLLDVSFEDGRATDGELDPDDSQVRYIL